MPFSINNQFQTPKTTGSIQMNIGLVGYGKMGRRIEALSEEMGCTVKFILDIDENPNGEGLTRERAESVDAIIDFSSAEVLPNTLKSALNYNVPMVIGTTGWLQSAAETDRLCKEGDTPVLYGSNFSLGVQLFAKLIYQAGKLFGNNAQFHSTLHEVHHTEKADAPSGTALTLAHQFLEGAGLDEQKKINTDLPSSEKVDPDALYITSQRLGSVFGEHQLRLNSPFDDIEVTHQARSRDAFAAGALKAANWVVNQAPGFYLVENVIEDIASS